MKNLSRKIDRIQRLVTPLITIGGKHETHDDVFPHLVAAQEELDRAFKYAEFPDPPLFDTGDWDCANPDCEFVAENVDGAPHRCPKCLSTEFIRAGVIGGPEAEETETEPEETEPEEEEPKKKAPKKRASKEKDDDG